MEDSPVDGVANEWVPRMRRIWGRKAQSPRVQFGAGTPVTWIRPSRYPGNPQEPNEPSCAVPGARQSEGHARGRDRVGALVQTDDMLSRCFGDLPVGLVADENTFAAAGESLLQHLQSLGDAF